MQFVNRQQFLVFCYFLGHRLFINLILKSFPVNVQSLLIIPLSRVNPGLNNNFYRIVQNILLEDPRSFEFGQFIKNNDPILIFNPPNTIVLCTKQGTHPPLHRSDLESIGIYIGGENRDNESSAPSGRRSR